MTLVLDTRQPSSSLTDVLFAALQPDRDTLTLPTASGTILLAGDFTCEYEPVVVKNDEKTGSYGAFPGVTVGRNMGTFSFASNVRVPGTAGAEPPGSALYESLMGRMTVTPGSDVTYEHYRMGDSLKWLTLLYRTELYTYLIKGAIIDKASFPISGKIFGANWSGFFGERYMAGTDELLSAIDGTSTPVTTIPLTVSAKNYDTGAYIVVGTDTNSGAGFLITGKDETAKTLTIADGVTTVQAAGAIVQGWTPTRQVSGSPIGDKIGDFKITRDGVSTPFDILSATLEVTNGFSPTEIPKGSLSPLYVKRGQRNVSLTLDRSENIDGLDLRAYCERFDTIPCEINIGEEQGSIVQIIIPDFRLEKLSVSGNEERKTGISGSCYQVTGDDEITLIFK